MNQLALSFTSTRHRRSDPDTSKVAAKNAVTGKSAEQRIQIVSMLRSFGPMNDHELEQHIADTGRLMQAAFARGDRDEAISWLHAQAEAIKGRSAAQVQRMEEGYFGARGAADRRALEAR